MSSRISLTAATVAAVALVAFASPARAQNLVTNGGFETGDFSGFTVTPAASGSGLDISPIFTNTGTFAAFFAATAGQVDTIAQNITTTPGGTYTFTFFLRNSIPRRDRFEAFFDNTSVLLLENTASAFAYTPFSFNVTASTVSTQIRFEGFDNPSAIFLDDISVTPVAVVPPAVPEPAAIVGVVAFVGVLGGLIVRRRIHTVGTFPGDAL